MQKDFYETRGVSQCGGLAKYLKAKERRIIETQIHSPCKNLNLQKISSKRNQNASRYYNSTPNLKFQHKPI
jgi:hypothetical protein